MRCGFGWKAGLSRDQCRNQPREFGSRLKQAFLQHLPNPVLRRRLLWRQKTTRELFIFEPRVAYIPIQKAANTTVKHNLRELGLFQLEPEEIDKIERDPQAIHGILGAKYNKSVRVFKIAVRSTNSFAFMIVRRPRERLESFYIDKVLGSGWSESASRNFWKIYGIRRGEPWASFIEKVLAVPGKFQNPHTRSIQETLRWAGLLAGELKIYPTTQLNMWRSDLLEHLDRLGYLPVTPPRTGP